MATFKAGDRAFDVRLTMGLIVRLRAEAGFDLAKAAADGSLVAVVLTDPLKLGGILWAACRRQAEAAGLTREAFDDLLGPEELVAGGDALLEASIDFHHGPARAAELKARLPAAKAAVNARLTAAFLAAAEQAAAALESTPAPAGEQG